MSINQLQWPLLRTCAFRSFLLSILLLSVAAQEKDNSEPVLKDSAEATVDTSDLELAVKWQSYAKSVAAALSSEKSVTASLSQEVQALKSQTLAYGNNLKAKEDKILELQQKIDAASTVEAELRSLLKETQAKASLVETLEAEGQDLKKKLSAAEKAAGVVESLKKKVADSESALNYARKALIAAEKEAAEKASELRKVSGSVIPPWIKEKAQYWKKQVVHEWNIQGKPLFQDFQTKAEDRLSTVVAWANPTITSAKESSVRILASAVQSLEPIVAIVEKNRKILSPVIGSHWHYVSTEGKKCFKTVQSQATKAYDAVADSSAPYVNKGLEIGGPYLEVITEALRPLFLQVYTFLKPYLSTLKAAVVDSHSQVKGSVKHLLVVLKQQQAGGSKVEVEEDSDVLWYLATAVMVIPLFLGFLLGLPLLGTSKDGVKSRGVKHGKKQQHRRSRKD